MKQLKQGVCSFLIIFVLSGLPYLIQAQTWQYRYRPSLRDIGYLTVGPQGGLINYFGDLNPLSQYASTDLSKTRPTIGINVARKLSPRLIARAGLSWGRLSANDFQAADPTDERHRYRFARNVHFRNDIFELSLIFTYDIFPSASVYYKRVPITPYILAGIAAFYHDPKARTPLDYDGGDADPGEWVRLRPLSTEGQGLVRTNTDLRPSANGSPINPVGAPIGTYRKPYSLLQPAIPLGAGVRFKVNDRMDISFEVAYRLLFTDFLDDVSGNYANPNDLTEQVGPLSATLANRTLETVDARSGRSRADELAVFLSEVNRPTLDQAGNLTISGYGNDGDKRGESSNTDIYIMAVVHLQYIIGVGLRCPGGRK
ncbi:MAG: hypothetical protein HC880_03675 [Bacteroidia bacterium]|nr:hypothetical protein [Bacteroidia bacterium]